jgi:hypothetical protein
MNQSSLTTRHDWLKRNCKFGLSHFCDGKPNLSENRKSKQREPCPLWRDCYAKQNKVFDFQNQR